MTDDILLEENTEEVVNDEPTPASTPTIFDKVKLALRISHTLLDGEINDVIASARSELIRAGVNETYANSDDELVETAIKTYALSYYATDKEAERYGESFKYQCDNLRKTFGVQDV